MFQSLNCSSKIDLKAIAEKMQVNQLFDPSSGAFGSFSDAPLHLTDIKQEANISIDEMGCSVASYIAIFFSGCKRGAARGSRNLSGPPFLLYFM